MKEYPKPQICILGDQIKAAREDLGISVEDLAVNVCLHKQQIHELESAQTHKAFYTMEIKIRAAKRVGAFLGLDESTYLRTESK